MGLQVEQFLSMNTLKHFAVLGVLTLTTCSGTGASDTGQLNVLTTAQAIARDVEALAAFNEEPNMATATNIVDAVMEAALGPSIYEMTDAEEILATGCASITLSMDKDTVVSAHVRIEKAADGSTGVVAAEGVCSA